MNKIVGIMTAHAAEDWIELALQQALSFCDEALVAVGANSPPLQALEDSTREVCSRYASAITLVDPVVGSNWNSASCATINRMMDISALCTEGNWVWLLSVDEFYGRSAYSAIRAVINEGQHDHICVEERFFFVNMQRYLTGSHGRLWKIKDPRTRFRPTNHWLGPVKSPFILPRDKGMFHYSLLQNPAYRTLLWEADVLGAVPYGKARWFREIYMNVDLTDEEDWIEQNQKLTGFRSLSFDRQLGADKDGRLFRYQGRHPELIERSGLTTVDDFRTFYDRPCSPRSGTGRADGCARREAR